MPKSVSASCSGDAVRTSTFSGLRSRCRMRCAWMPRERIGDLLHDAPDVGLRQRPAAHAAASSVPPGTYSRSSYAAPSDTPWSSTRTTVSPTDCARIVEQAEVGLDASAIELRDAPSRRCARRRRAGCRLRCRWRGTRRRRDSARAAPAGSGRAPAIGGASARSERLQYTQRSLPGGFGCAQSGCGQIDRRRLRAALRPALRPRLPPPEAAAAGACFSEKSTPASDAPHAQRARSGGFSVSQTGQTRTYSLATRPTLPAPRHFGKGEAAARAQRFDRRHVAASRDADHPHAAAFDGGLHALAVRVGGLLDVRRVARAAARRQRRPAAGCAIRATRCPAAGRSRTARG